MTDSKESEILKELENDVRLYHKIGGYYKISWKEFKETPWPVIRLLCKILDESADDLTKFIGYEEFFEYRNLLRLHNPKQEDKPLDGALF